MTQVPVASAGTGTSRRRARSESSSTDGPARKMKRFTHPKDLEGWDVWHYDPDNTIVPAVDLSDQFVSDRPGVPMPKVKAKEAMHTVMKMLEGKDGVYSYFWNDKPAFTMDAEFLPQKDSTLYRKHIGGKYLRTDWDEYVSESQDRSMGYEFTWRVCAWLDPTKSGKNSRRCYWYGLRNLATEKEFTMYKGPQTGPVKELLQLHTIVGPKIV